MGEKKFPEAMKEYRDFFGRRYLKGRGVEIGAGWVPTAFDPSKAEVIYVDYLPVSELRKIYAELPDAWMEPDIVDDGTVLSKFGDKSLTFIVACHVLEHTEDPIGVLKTWISKVRKDGVIYISIPDKRFCFDRERPLTTLDHVVRDHRDGGAASRRQHLVEFARLAMKTPEPEVESKADELQRRDYRIHFHTWDQHSFLDFLWMFRERYHSTTIEHYGRNDTEILTILRV